MQIGHEQHSAAQADGNIAVLSGTAHDRDAHYSHGCPNCPHPAGSLLVPSRLE